MRKQRTDGRRSQVSAGDPKEEQMSFSFKSATRRRWAWAAALVVAWGLSWPQPALAEQPHLITVMTRNMVLDGDFNANAEPGPEHTGAVAKIESRGFTDAWKSANPGDPGYTWLLFGEDQASGPKAPNERIDLIFIGGPVPPRPGRTLKVLSAQRTGTKEPWASDHAGVVVELRLE
ncbi:MAG: hypothetical protein NT090_02310 [Acidobacteria bacterium]|nr:hypothetical protein [Acidobacteriota bacterium]